MPRCLPVAPLALLALLALTMSATPSSAQSTVGSDPGSSVRTRADLERLLGEYEQALASPVYSEAVKRGIRADAEMIRGRLQNGDFRVGDRIVLDVQGEATLPDTVQVEPGPMIVLPLFGEISLAGVLRSEITAHLTEALGRMIIDPVVRANGLMRLSIVGQVARPGFYTVPAEMLVGEALMAAGGPAPTANLEAVRIDRGSAAFLEGNALQEAMRNGLTLDQLNLQAGDQIVVPQQASGGLLGTIGIVASILGSVLLVVQLAR